MMKHYHQLIGWTNFLSTKKLLYRKAGQLNPAFFIGLWAMAERLVKKGAIGEEVILGRIFCDNREGSSPSAA
jgi:hypothetical protein